MEEKKTKRRWRSAAAAAIQEQKKTGMDGSRLLTLTFPHAIPVNCFSLSPSSLMLAYYLLLLFICSFLPFFFVPSFPLSHLNGSRIKSVHNKQIKRSIHEHSSIHPATLGHPLAIRVFFFLACRFDLTLPRHTISLAAFLTHHNHFTTLAPLPLFLAHNGAIGRKVRIWIASSL
jgi:hypothetical protein